MPRESHRHRLRAQAKGHTPTATRQIQPPLPPRQLRPEMPAAWLLQKRSPAKRSPAMIVPESSCCQLRKSPLDSRTNSTHSTPVAMEIQVWAAACGSSACSRRFSLGQPDRTARVPAGAIFRANFCRLLTRVSHHLIGENGVNSAFYGHLSVPAGRSSRKSLTDLVNLQNRPVVARLRPSIFLRLVFCGK